MAASSIRRTALVACMTALVLTLGGTAAWTWTSNAGQARAQSGPDLPILNAVPDFSLVDQQGTPVGSKDLKGKVWVASLLDTHCEKSCETVSESLAYLCRRFRGEANVRLLSFAVDPANDTPEVLARYLERFEVSSERWCFATGSTEIIQAFAREGLRLGTPDEPLAHSTLLVLVDSNRRIRGYYDGTDRAQVRRLARDIAQLAEQKVRD